MLSRTAPFNFVSLSLITYRGGLPVFFCVAVGTVLIPVLFRLEATDISNTFTSLMFNGTSDCFSALTPKDNSIFSLPNIMLSAVIWACSSSALAYAGSL
ncbi:hypothetical protein Barb7_02638 [Bacteroidales bacterium Barb7]|nr:hypothetical protein Barb7_02638 [Bacteroidales bacterium Barb7]